MGWVLGISTIITAQATVFLAIYNWQLLKRMDRQHQFDVFIRSYPFRIDLYEQMT